MGESYLVQVGCNVKVQTAKAAARLRALMLSKALHFNGAGDDSLTSISQSWSVEHASHPAKRDQNHALLDEVAAIANAFPGVMIEVRGEAGSARVAPARLAAHYKLRQREDALLLMAHLARNRATACVNALIARGVPAARLRPSFKRSGYGRLTTEFVPLPLDGPLALAFEPVVREFTVAAQAAAGAPVVQVRHLPTHLPWCLPLDLPRYLPLDLPPFMFLSRLLSQPACAYAFSDPPPLLQHVDVPIMRTTADLIVRLVTARTDSLTHWSSALAVASGVPVVVRHKGLGIEVLRATVYDGEVRIPASLLCAHLTRSHEISRDLTRSHEIS